MGESQKSIRNDPESARYKVLSDAEDSFGAQVPNLSIVPTPQKMKRPEDVHHELRSKERVITKIDYESIKCTVASSPNINSQGHIGCQGARYGYRGNVNASQEYCIGEKDGNIVWPWFKKCCIWEDTKKTCESIQQATIEKEE